MSKYNLILFHAPQCISDFWTIKNMMAGQAPDIEVHCIARGDTVAPDFWSGVAERPTLLFSPLEKIPVDHAVRGTQMHNTLLGKLAEMEMLAKAGVPILRTEKIVPDIVLDESEWGPFVVVKPDTTFGGKGVRLERTKEVRWFDPKIYPRNDSRRGTNMLVQRYVYTGLYAQCYRVFTVLGRVIYSIVSIATEVTPRPDPANKDATDIRIAVNRDKRVIKENYDEEVLALAESVHLKFPSLPSLGIDIIREHETGRLFVLEINAGGGTWHLSTQHGLMHQRTCGLDLYGQFNALQRITDALIDTTRKLAV